MEISASEVGLAVKERNATMSESRESPILVQCSMAMTSAGLLLNIAFMVWIHRRNIIPGVIPRTLITNLCVSDSITCLLNVLLYAINDRIDVPLNWFGGMVCRLTYGWYVYWAACQTSINSMVLLTVERYVSVVHPSKYRRHMTIGLARLLIVVSWLLGAALMSFSLFRADRVGHRCDFVALPWTLARIRSASRIVTYFIVPLVLTVYCNLQVVLTLRRHQRSLQLGRRNEEAQRVIVCFTLTAGVAFIFLIGPDALFHFIDSYFVALTHAERGFYLHLVGLLLDTHAILNPILHFVTLNRCCRRRGASALICCIQPSRQPDTPSGESTIPSVLVE